MQKEFLQIKTDEEISRIKKKCCNFFQLTDLFIDSNEAEMQKMTFKSLQFE